MEVFNDYRQNGVEKVEKKHLNFLDLMIEYNSENQITMEQLREEVDTFMFAGKLFDAFNFQFFNLYSLTFLTLIPGHDTTAHAVIWSTWCLATHPDIQERLYNEIADNFGKSGADFRTNKLKELKYLDAVFKESMRLFAPVPFIQRTLKEDQMIGGHLIPKNTSVSISPFMLHRSPKVSQFLKSFEYG